LEKNVRLNFKQKNDFLLTFFSFNDIF